MECVQRAEAGMSEQPGKRDHKPDTTDYTKGWLR